MASGDFEMKKWFEKNPQYRRSNGNFLFKKLKQEWSMPVSLTPEQIIDRPRSTRAMLSKTRIKSRRGTDAESRRERVDIRRCIIMHLEAAEMDDATAAGNERENVEADALQRYRHFIDFGANAMAIRPMDKVLLEQIEKYTPKYKRWPSITAALMDEVSTEFGMAVRKSIVEFALQDARHRRRIDKVPYFSHNNMYAADAQRLAHAQRYRQHRQTMRRDLNNINPCIAHMTRIWSRMYATTCFVSPAQLSVHTEPFDLLNFVRAAFQQIDAMRNELAIGWYDALRDTFIRGKKKKHTPERSKPKALQQFFDCISAMMTLKLTEVCLRSLTAYTDFLCDTRRLQVHLRLQVLLAAPNVIVYNPTVDEFEKQLLRVIDKILEAVQSFPRLESKVFLDNLTNRNTNLSPSISSELIATCKQRICDRLQQHRIAPEKSLDDFSDFNELMDGRYAEEVRQLVAGDVNFTAFCAKVAFFHDIADRLHGNLWSVRIMGIFEFHREGLIEQLQTLTLFLQTEILSRMVIDQQHDMKCVHSEYESFCERITTVPKTTAELMNLVEFLSDGEEQQLPVMQTKIIDNMQRVIWLMDKHIYTAIERKRNTMAVQMYLRMPEALAECRAMIEDKTVELKEKLNFKVQYLNEDLSLYRNEMALVKNFGDLTLMPVYRQKVTALHTRLEQANERIDRINEEEIAYDLPLTQYPLRKEVHDDLAPFKTFFDTAQEFAVKHATWMSSTGGTFEADEVAQEIDNLYRVIQKLDRKFDDTPLVQQMSNGVKDAIQEFKSHANVIQVFGNCGLRPRHWTRMAEIVNEPAAALMGLTLSGLINMQLDDRLVELREISENASKENTIEKAILRMMDEWKIIKFTVHAYKDTGSVILSGVDDIETLLDDHRMKIQAIKLSPNIANFEDTINRWERVLGNLLDILSVWLKVQAGWMYLEPIFSSPDIQQQMPEEGRRFNAVDKIWRDLMEVVEENPSALAVEQIDQILESLQKAFNLLEAIQKGLNLYLEKKRLYFPRFFFLSNDEMLEILSETKDPTRVQPHLKKCFEGIARLKFNENLDIELMTSSEGEEVRLEVIISTSKARGQVEKWLLELEGTMKKSVHGQVRYAYEDYPTVDRHCWVLRWPGQCVQSVSLTYWTHYITAAFLADQPTLDLQQYHETCGAQLKDIVALVRGQLSVQNRITLGALIVLDVHANEIIGELIRCKVTSVRDFTWISQMRYYWEDAQLVTRMINSPLNYGYEYLGNTTRLVITPLTDRCYRTLYGALNLHLGGAPEGPAGTGKTETTKDLAKAVAKQCVVFNCSDGLDYIALGKFFKGLASCGAWSCFDEFNRIDLEVLSVVAQQILTIQRGINSGSPTLLFEGTLLQLDSSCAIFITMNPGYAGRSELPDNLKALFRSVAMMVPDYALIAEIELYSYGFIAAKSLAVKIVATYKLCSEQLSTQPHYDYGMRAVKSVLKAAGALKLQFPDEAEDTIVLRSIKDVNKAKFLIEDVLLFQGIINDLFPTTVAPQTDYSAFDAAVAETCIEMNLQCTEFFLEKIQQLYEMILVRHGLMITGFSFGGKTSAYRVLATALGKLCDRSEMNENHVVYAIINPKSLTMGQLYGEFDALSHEWSDGVLAVKYREFAMATTPDRKWLMFDGPVDAIWIENINTVRFDS